MTNSSTASANGAPVRLPRLLPVYRDVELIDRLLPVGSLPTRARCHDDDRSRTESRRDCPPRAPRSDGDDERYARCGAEEGTHLHPQRRGPVVAPDLHFAYLVSSRGAVARRSPKQLPGAGGNVSRGKRHLQIESRRVASPWGQPPPHGRLSAMSLARLRSVVL